MKKRILAVLLASCIMFTFLAACGGGGGGGQTNTPAGDDMDLDTALETMDTVNLNWAISLGSSHRANDIFQYFADEVKERTNGKVNINLYPGDTLVTSNSIYDSLVQGIVDMGEADPAYSVAAFPMCSALFLPNMNFANSVVSTYVADEFFTTSDLPEFDRAHFLFAFGMSPSIIFGNREVKSLADFSGMQIRATGFAIDVVEGLGASAVGITPAETYEALLKGTADAALMPAEALLNWNFAEVCDYACKVTGLSTSFHYVAINSEKWNALPTAVQQVMEEVADECVEKISTLWDEMGEEGYAYAAEHDTVVYEMSADAQAECLDALTGVVDNWVEDYTAQGHDAQGTLDYLQGLIDKYNGEYADYQEE